MERAGSRMMRSAPICGWEKAALWLFRKSVAPAKGEYSPPEREVGMLITGSVGGFKLGVWTSVVSFARSSRIVALFAIAYFLY